MLQISLQPSPRLKCFEQNWELLISYQFYRRFSSGLPETSVVIKKVTRSLSVHCMLFNIQVAIPRKYSIHWTNTVDSFTKKARCANSSQEFLDILPPPLILLWHGSPCASNTDPACRITLQTKQGAKNFLCLLLDSWEVLPGSSTGYSPRFPSLLVCLQLTQHGHKKPQQVEHSLKALAHKRRVHCGVHQGKVG